MLAADFLNLGKDVEVVNRYADIFHLDVMDGTLVPNISFGFPVIEAIAKKAEKPMDVHLMIVHPEKYVERFAKVGAAYISFHLEAAQKDGTDPREIIALIRQNGAKAGIAVNPDFPLEGLFPYLNDVDFVLIMSVFAGFGGQKFIESTYDRVEAVRKEADRIGAKIEIEVDGGVSPSNSAKLKECGAGMLVAGSAVFKSDDPKSVIESMK